MRIIFLLFLMFVGNLFSDDINDPFEEFNRKTFDFNEKLDDKIAKPLAEIYSKTPKSKSLFCAGYYIICFEKGWRKAYCPKLITLQRYPFKGPIKTKLEMQQVLNNAIKEQNTNTSN